MRRGLERLASSSALQRRLFADVAAHRLHLLFLILLFPLFAYGPEILEYTWAFLVKGFHQHVLFGVFVTCLVMGIYALVILFYLLDLYDIFLSKRWSIRAPIEMGFLYFAFVGIVYGVSLGYSLFAEQSQSLGGMFWWLQLWMSIEFFFYLTRLFFLISTDKFLDFDIASKVAERIKASDHSLLYGFSLYGVAILLFFWYRSEGVSHATATALMFTLMLDQVLSGLFPMRVPSVEGGSLRSL